MVQNPAFLDYWWCKMKKDMLIVLVIIISIVSVGFAAKSLYFSNNVPSNNNQITNTGDGDAQIVKLGFSKYNYDPSTITVKSGVPVKIVADMAKLQGCYRYLQIPTLGVKKAFSEKDNTLVFTPTEPGTYDFSCSMGMGRGTLIVQ